MDRQLREVLANDAALTGALRQLPRRAAPPEMTTRLRSIAAREQRRRRQTWQERIAEVLTPFRLAFENVMRPLALPAVGGVFSAVTLFSVCVVPAYPLQIAHRHGDIPTQLTTDAKINYFAADSEHWGGTKGNFAVDITVGKTGELVDYHIDSDGYTPNVGERRNLEDILLVHGKYEPATNFGKPTTSKIRMQFSRVDVKG